MEQTFLPRILFIIIFKSTFKLKTQETFWSYFLTKISKFFTWFKFLGYPSKIKRLEWILLDTTFSNSLLINKSGTNRNFSGFQHQDSHNTYIQFLFEYGIFGGLVLFYLCFVLIHRFTIFRRVARIDYRNAFVQRDVKLFYILIYEPKKQRVSFFQKKTISSRPIVFHHHQEIF